MAASTQLVDTNVIVRFLTGEPPDMALKARRLIERADNGEVVLVVFPLIVAETMFTLESYYEFERKDVAAKLLTFLQSGGIRAVENDRVIATLTKCRDKNSHFADAYLATAAQQLEQPIASFDRDFDKFKDVKRIEPRAD